MITLELDSASPTLLDGVSTDDGSTVTTTGTVDVSTVDDYTIRYDSTDGTNAATTVTRTYHVTDTKAPIITVDPLEVTLELDSASPTLLDGVSTDDGSTVTATGTVVVSTVGDYTIRYDSTDGTNAATTVTRTYHVTDTTAPTITVDPLVITLELDSASPTLLDGVSTDDGSTVTATGTVVVSTVGDYTINYDSTDGTNAATTVTRTYHVTDTTAPTITVTPLVITLELDSASPTLLDGVSTDDGSTVTATGTVVVSTVGDYTINYDSTDGTNAATTVTRTYHVTDTTAPTITVTPLVITLELDSASPTLLDGVSTDDGSTVTATGTVVVSTVGDYTINYDSTDGTNAATTVTRTYHVTDTTAPTITVTPLVITLELDSASPTLLDGVSTDDGSTVTATGTVVVSTVGDYTINYDSTDGTNAATTVTRTYHVTDTTAPTITVTPLEVTLELDSASPTLLDGVSTDDGSTVTATGTVVVSTVGDYTINYDSTDGTNAATTVTRTYHVTDTTAPTITVTPLVITLELDSASPTLLDGVSTDDGSTVTATGTVVVSTVGDYTINYDSTDGTNAATTVTRTYHVTDTTAPTITVTPLEVTLELDSASPTLLDGVSTDDGSTVTATGTVVVSTVGDYTINYDSTDGTNAATTVTRTYHVTDTTAPTITVTPLVITLELDSASPTLLDGVSTDDGSTVTATGTVVVSTVGDYTINYDSTDGTNAATTVTRTYHVTDTKAPAIPVFTNSTATVSSSPVTLAGTAEADSTVTLYKDETFVATATATGGTFEFAGVTLAEERNSFTATATDAALNVSAKSGALVITLDTAAPAAPIFTNSTTTVSSSPVTLAGTAEADSVITLYKGETFVATATATGGIFEFAGVTLAEERNSFTVTATDAVLNTSAKSGALVITLDTTAPVFATSTDTTDVTFGDTVPTLSTLCTDANTITVTNDAGSITFDAVGAKTVIYTCTDAAGNTAIQSVSYSVAAAPSTFNERASSSTSKTVVDGTIYHNLGLVWVEFDFTGDGTSVDRPRSSNIIVTNGVMLSASNSGTNGTSSFYHQYFVQPSSDGTVTVTYPANSFIINGASNDAVTYTFVSDRTHPTFEAGADFSTVELTVGDDFPTLSTLQCRDTYISTTSAPPSGSVNANLAGDYPVEYTCTDNADNSVTKTKTYRVLADFAAPAAPIFTNSTTTVSSSPVTLAGTAEADSTVTLYKDETFVATATATGGIFEFAGVTLAEERNSFTATATDAALNVSAKSGALVITLDTAAPAAPIFTNSTTTVSSSPVTLAGTAEADSTVTLYKDETSVATATATGGIFEFAGVTLAEERNSFTATATDAALNVSAKSGALVITLDTTAPVFATSTDTTDVTFGDTVPTLSTLCTDANTITVTNDAGSITFDAVGAKTVIYTCTDAAGNTAIQSVSYSVAAAPSTFNERASSSTSKTVVDGTIYHNLGLVWVEFDFTGDGTSVDRPRSSNIIVTNGVMLSASNSGTNGTSSFYHQYFVQPSSDGTVTVTYPANSFIINGASNDAVTYTFVSDRTHPTFEAGADFSTVELTVGDDFPTLSTLQCRDTYISTTSAPPSGSVNANLAGDYPVEYTCTDNADNSVTKTKTYRVLADFAAPAAPIFTNSTTTVSSSPVTLAGTAEADSTVTLYKDETFVATATATGGIFEFAGVTLAEERNSFTATATDAALNVSAKSGALVITLDTAAPAAPIFTNSTTTVSSSPVTLAGTAEADSTVTLYKDETSVATATATGGIFEFAGVTLAEERNSFTATATDAALNVSAKSGALVITLDTAAPAAPIFTNSTTTVSSSPVTLAGTAEADSTVTLYKDETFVATATATGGIFEFAGVTLAEERNSFTLTATDAALNVSAKSGALVITLDTAAPAAPIFTNSTTTVSSSPVTLAGTAEADSVITLYKDETFVATATATGGIFEFAGVTLAEERNSFTLTATDAALNVSAKSGALVITLDTAAPAAPIFTNSTTTVSSSPVTLAGTAEADSVITLYKDETSVATATATGGIFEFAGVTLAEERNSFTATATDAALNVSAKSGALVITLDTAAPAAPIFTNSTTTVSSSPVTLAGTAEADSVITLYKDETFVATATATGGIFEFAGVTLAEERNSFTATATDAALNVSAKSGALVITLDTAAPAAPIFTNSTTTVSSSPVTLAGTAEADSVITLYKDETFVATATATGGIFEFAGVTLAEERNSFTATATDAALNVSAKSGALVITLDTAAPAAPIFTNSTATVSSSPVTLAGTAEADSVITLYKDETFVATATATGGIFEFAGVTLAEERNSFTATATDAALNVSAKSGALVITLDTAAPAAPIFTNSTATVSSSPVTLAGTAEADSVITLYKDETFVATATATGGIFEFAGVTLAEGSNGFTLTATDAALNVSAKSGALVITLDTAAPAAPIFTNSTTTVSSSPVTLAGTAEADSVITLYKDETFVATATATGGIFEFAGVTLAEERNSFTATATDAALNVSAKSGALVITLDTAAPAAPIFTNSTATVSSSPVTLAGTAEADSVITLYKDETFVATATATGGIFEFAGVTLAEERNSFTATATDAALNVSAKSGALVITLDTAAPAAPIFTNSTATVSSSPVTLAGTAEADSVITLYKDETFVATATATGGIFEFAGVTLAEERNSFTATATDAALNVSVKSGALVITLDTAAPAAPIFTNSTATVSSSPVTLAGTAEADSVITLYKDETFVATATATGGIFEFAGVTLAEGSNGFTLTATDAALNVSVKSGALVITLDTAAPAAPIFTNSTATVSSSPVTLAGTAEADSVITLYKDETFVATATATGGIFEFAGVTLAEGSNGFTLTATDAALNVSVKSGALVITLDTAAPTITVTPLVITLELDSVSPTLLDGVSTDDGSTVTATGTVVVSTVGDYTINYDSTDGTNAATTVTRTYHVTDTTAPTITVTPLVITLELDSASPTLLDGVSTDDGSTVTATGTVVVSTVGDYTINYDSTDGTNAATTVTRTYHVTDTTAPTITVTPLEVTLELDSASPTLLDGVSTDDGSTVTATGTVVVSTVGDYTINYDSTDGTNAATIVTRTYHVTDTTAPTITVTPLVITLELDSASPTLLDGVSTDDGSTVTATGTVVVSTVGDYTINYDSTDGTNAATTVTRTYHVTDTTAPTITVTPLVITLELDSASPTLLDGVSTDDGSTVTATGTVVVSTVGDYTINYDSTDGTNAATTVTRTYHVTDTTAPTITVTPLEVTLELDSASPTLLDGVSTDDGSTVTATGTVVVSTVGDYTINYDSTDGTNAATTVTRTYHVTDTTAPTITVTPLVITLELDSASPTLLDGVSTDDGSTVTTVTATGTVMVQMLQLL